MKQEMLKLASIAESFEKSGDVESGRLVTEAMREISALNLDPLGLKDKASKVVNWLGKMLEGKLSPETIQAIIELAIKDITSQKL